MPTEPRSANGSANHAFGWFSEGMGAAFASLSSLDHAFSRRSSNAEVIAF